MVQFLSIIFFLGFLQFWGGVFKSSRFFVSPCTSNSVICYTQSQVPSLSMKTYSSLSKVTTLTIGQPEPRGSIPDSNRDFIFSTMCSPSRPLYKGARRTFPGSREFELTGFKIP